MNGTHQKQTQGGCQPLCCRLSGISREDGGKGKAEAGRAWAYYLRNVRGKVLAYLKHSSQVSTTRKGSVPIWNGKCSGIWPHTLATFMLGETSQLSLLPVAHSLPSGQPAQSRSHPVGPQAQARAYMQASGLPSPSFPCQL